MLKRFAIVSMLGMFTLASTAQAQSAEERFQDVFITAGYATAFGAALGAASLSFYGQPEKHLNVVAIGASLGFIGGSILGSYIVLSPVIADSNYGPDVLSALNEPSDKVVLAPVIDDDNMITGFAGGLNLVNF